MGLKLVYGPSGSGKSRFCLDDMSSELSGDRLKTLILIVPEQFSLQAERNLTPVLRHCGGSAAEVLSFRRLAHRVFSEVGGREGSILAQPGKNMLLRRIAESITPEMKVFGKAARQKGFIAEVSGLIAEFKRYCVTPEMISDVIMELEQGSLSDKLHDLNLIFSVYEKEISGRYSDPDDDLNMLKTKIGLSSYLKDSLIWIDGFSGFTPQEFGVISTLLRTAANVTVALCADDLSGRENGSRKMLFEPVLKTAEKLLNIAFEQKIRVLPMVKLPLYELELPRFSCSKALKHLENNLYKYPYTQFADKPSGISILTASNPLAEVEDTARKILSLCRDEGYRYRDIAVVAGNMDNYSKLISRIFNLHGISFFMDSKRDIMSNSIVSFIKAAIEIVQSNWSYESMFKYIKTGHSGLSRSETDILENYVLANGIRGGFWTESVTWEFKPARRFAGDTAEEKKNYLQEVNRLRELVVKPLAEFQIKVKGKLDAQTFAVSIFELLEQNRVYDRTIILAENLKQRGLNEKAAECIQVWNSVILLLDQLVEAAGDKTMDLDALARMLETGLSEYSIGLAPASLDQVLVGNIERSKSHEIKALFVLGVSDGIFPASAGDEGTLTDIDRIRLAGAGIELAKDTRLRALEERYLVYTTLTIPEKLLRICCPAVDNSGKTLRPSRVIADIKKLFPEISTDIYVLDQEPLGGMIELVSAPAPTFNKIVGPPAKNQKSAGTDPVWAAAQRWFARNGLWRERLQNMSSYSEYYSQSSSIDNERASLLFGDPIKSSVSKLETYSQCPFSYFVKYGLKAEERKIFEIKAVDTGTLMHAAIETFSLKMQEAGKGWKGLNRPESFRELSAIVDGIMAENAGGIFSRTERNKYIAERLKKVLTRSVMLVSMHFDNSGFEAVSYETAFGENEKYPPIVVNLASGKIMTLEGRIDRIDSCSSEDGTYVRIIDYKSGDNELKLNDIYHGLQLQLLTYLDAVLKSKPGLLPGGMLYFRLDDPLIHSKKSLDDEKIEDELCKKLKMKGILLDDEKLIREMDGDISGSSRFLPVKFNKDGILLKNGVASAEKFKLLRKYVNKTLEKLGDAIANGEAAPAPYKKKSQEACTYCPYLAICRFDTALPGNNYRLLAEYDEETIWNKMR